jgi:hypothetical protein
MRRELLDLHRTLVDAERREYERTRGRMTDRAFLAALISAPELAWLNPLTSLIVRLEELLEDTTPQSTTQRDDCVAEIRKLLKPAAEGQGFQRKYEQAMQRSPDVVVAHGKVIRALKSKS